MKNFKRIFISTVLILPNVLIVLGAETAGKLVGRVIDNFTKQPLEYVNVYLVDTSFKVVTNENGDYKIVNVPKGIYQLEASMLGYKSVAIPDIAINPHRATIINIELEPTLVFQLPEIKVTPEYFSKPDYSAVSTLSIDYEEMSKSPGPPCMFRRLQSMPGVLGANDYSPYLIVRGGSPEENLTLIDNIEIYSPFHFAEFGGTGGAMSIVEPKLIKRTDFSAGGFGVEYGDKLSSVTRLWLREARKEGFAGDVYMNMGGSGLFLEGPAGTKASYIIGARRGIWDMFMEMQDKDYHPYTWDFHNKICFEPSVNHKLSIVGVYSTDTFWGTEGKEEGREVETYEKTENYTTTFGVNWRWLYGKRGYMEFTPWINSNGWKKNEGPLNNKEKDGVEAKETYYGTKIKITQMLSETIEMSMGSSFKIISPSYLQWEGTDTLRTSEIIQGYRVEFKPEFSYKLSSFGQLSFSIIKDIKLIPGVRYDYFEFTKEECVSPRIGLSLPLSEATKLNATYGIYYQSPEYWKISLDTANYNLNASRANQYIIGVEHLFAPDLQFLLEAYHKDLSKLLVRESEKGTKFSNSGKGFSSGVDMSILKKMSDKLFFTIAYTVSKSKRKDTPASKYYDFDYDSPNIFNLLTTYRPSQKWQVGMVLRYFSGLPYTPYNLSTRYQDDGKWYCKQGQKNSARYPDYMRLDIRIDRKFVFSNWALDAYLDTWNILNHENVASYLYSDDFTTKTPVTLFPLMPMFGIAVEF